VTRAAAAVNRSIRRWAIGALAVTWMAATAAESPPDFDNLPDAKALAVVPERPAEARGVAHSQPHDLAASFAAVRQCQDAAAPGEHCELVRLNDEWITSGAEIRSMVPAGPHPLFLWRYRHGTSAVHLAGSIHVLKPSLYPLPDEYEAAFRGSDHLVLEVDLERTPPAMMQQKTLAAAALPKHQSLRDLLPISLYERLDRRLAVYGMSIGEVSGNLPALIMNQLLLARLMALGYSPEFGLEGHFLRQRSHQRVLELETFDAQLAVLFGQPLSTQIELLEEALDTEQDLEPMLAALLVAWLSGDDARFMELFAAQSGDTPGLRAYQTALLDDRNAAMAAAVAEFLQPGDGMGGSYFVLVGSAHLVGENGIVNLLARQGIHGERIHVGGP
jgi:uncharacterized protein